MTDAKLMRAEARRHYERLLGEAGRACAERCVDALPKMSPAALASGSPLPGQGRPAEGPVRHPGGKARELLFDEDPLGALYTWLIASA